MVGPPGAGKGTQCRLLATKLGIVHVSVGHLLRAEQRKQSSLWRADSIADHYDHHTKIPNEVYLELLRDELYKHVKEGRRRFFVDGFPRTVEHLEYFIPRYVRIQTIRET